MIDQFIALCCIYLVMHKMLNCTLCSKHPINHVQEQNIHWSHMTYDAIYSPTTSSEDIIPLFSFKADNTYELRQLCMVLPLRWMEPKAFSHMMIRSSRPFGSLDELF